MRICVLSRFWPEDERSGVTLAAAKHVEILVDNGYDVSIIGSGKGVIRESLVKEKYQVPASGSGAIYAPARLDRALLGKTFKRIAPDLLVIEAWQTAITDGAVEVASQMRIPILMVSHGISLFPHNFTLAQLVRSAGWQFYRLFKLPRLIQKLSILTALDLNSNSPRFYDRDLAIKLKVPVVPLVNSSFHPIPPFCSYKYRKSQVLILGYFSAIKNQLGAISVINQLDSDLSFLFIGPRSGKYFKACVSEVKKRGLVDRVTFKEDHECDLSQEISRSLIIYSPSLTEALPVTLIEAMACGTPFVATPVGANTSLNGGILAFSKQNSIDAINALHSEKQLWEKYSLAGRAQYQSQFTLDVLEKQLIYAVNAALKKSVQK
jgi:glycosyltransferase involved in cell wall biosynthesis